ncbi:hypothetical protein HMI54_014306 [Coelomomyces lativittatus]|nr:hypothetical protein HMI55_004848 [Coelomomyces lativittatus]KAJ1514282.1 hypothetical protein HMI54_014306 [Coelomomyces lativittatus]KAJ1514704.1 hypothetical protein HMI56_007615 [Coelomomyces lativittatus]
MPSFDSTITTPSLNANLVLATDLSEMSKKLKGYDFYKEKLKSAKFICAPMVDQSALAWRQLTRRYNVDLPYSPMIHAKIFSECKNETQRLQHFSTLPSDRPLIVQFCGNHPEYLLKAAKLVEHQCDAVDLNLGCPQGIAKKGHYGCFLQEDWPLIESIVSTLDQNLTIPVTCKIRIFPDVTKTVAYAKMIEKAGCQLLTVHGRLREQKGQYSGLADWEQIKAVKQAVSIPVFANGNILYFEDVQKCIDATGVDGVMSAEGLLNNPALFSNLHPPVWELSFEYLTICKDILTPPSFIRAHLFRIFRSCINDMPSVRELLCKAQTIEDFERVTTLVQDFFVSNDPNVTDFTSLISSSILTDENGYKEIPKWACQPYIRNKQSLSQEVQTAVLTSLSSIA